MQISQKRSEFSRLHDRKKYDSNEFNKSPSSWKWRESINSIKVLLFIDFTNYNKKFIEEYFKKAIPFTNLTKNDISWKWKSTKKRAFQELKEAYSKKFIVKMFDSAKNVRMETDALNLAIEACILQMHDKKWHSIIYFSRKLTSVEQNYNIYDKELLRIIITLKQWRVYAEEALFLTIYTDHKNLITFTTIKQLNQKQIRWSELLNQYKLKIVYISEKENGRIDALNRQNDYMQNKEIFNQNVFKINNNESLSFNKREFNVTMRIFHDN